MEFRINDLEEIIQRLKNEKNINDTQISNKNQSDNNDDNVFDNKVIKENSKKNPQTNIKWI
ncbi:4727_t:CDS:2 [Entrophospora sp. SA101]|nr:4727_t:CDS:2 [Entrophospora sp. SA101]CAJ0919561.1 5910_t:CDS:2 [Entrophospora sp. SA101]